MKGITRITKGRAFIAVPPDMPEDEVWRYGLGFPFQVSPEKAGIFCNIRKDGTKSVDLEIGSDAVIFDDLSDINAENAVPLSRYEMSPASLTRKGPVVGGFVPLGAKLADGSPHPHAGTGFGMCWVIRHNLDETENFEHRLHADRYAELFQFTYDGKDFNVIQKEPVRDKTLLPEWNLIGNFITNAIPDGEDMLFTMAATIGDVMVSGISRWQAGAGGWRPVSFVPITGNEYSWFEPSLIRDTDGSLLVSARNDWRVWPENQYDTAVWRSADNGETWKQVIFRKDYRAQSTVSINQAADGTPFVVVNMPPLDDTREILSYCPLNESRTDFKESRVIRDLPKEIGPPPSGSWWRVDHPNSAIVRLKDGKYHGLLVYRIVDNMEIMGGTDPSSQTGCYVEEIISEGKVIPTWNF